MKARMTFLKSKIKKNTGLKHLTCQTCHSNWIADVKVVSEAASSFVKQRAPVFWWNRATHRDRMPPTKPTCTLQAHYWFFYNIASNSLIVQGTLSKFIPFFLQLISLSRKPAIHWLAALNWTIGGLHASLVPVGELKKKKREYDWVGVGRKIHPLHPLLASIHLKMTTLLRFYWSTWTICWVLGSKSKNWNEGNRTGKQFWNKSHFLSVFAFS